MRWFHVGLLVVAACGGTEEGALLVLEAPAGATAERIEIILASADEAMIEDVQNQRVAPTALQQEPVRYYRQRAITGELSNVGLLDGFSVRLEPSLDVPEGKLIPMLFAFDAQDQITAIGAVLDNGMPRPVEIIDDQLLRFEVAMTVVTQTDGRTGITTNEVVVVDCTGFRSGLAWRTGDTQIRLLLPDQSQDLEATDASTRTSDLDCDGGKAIADDCDDLRSEFHAGAIEACDGMDYDCDFHAQELVPCTGITTGCGATTGVGICQDRGTSNGVTACSAEPECACDVGGQCAACVVSFEGGDGMPSSVCSPSIAHDVFVELCGGNCAVEVLARPGDPFKVAISLPGANAFSEKLTGVTGKIDLEVQFFEELDAGAGDLVGGIFLAVTPVDGASSSGQLSLAVKLGQPTTCDPRGATMVCGQL